MSKKPPKEDFVFEGFEPANTTPVPDVLFDILLAELTGTELKILLYIIRRTWGFKKDADAISLSQFQKGITTKDGRVLDRGSGVSDRKTVLTTLSSLETKGCIQIVRSKTASGDNDTSIYRINFKGVVGKTNHLPSGVVGKTNHGSGKNQPRVVVNSNPQETVIQQTELQETVESIATQPLAPSVALPTASKISLSSFSQEETQEEIFPIDGMTTGNDRSVEQQPLMPDLPNKPSSKKKEKHTEDLAPKKAPEMPLADMAWGTKKCMMLFDAWRGHTLIGYYKLTQASTCAKELSIQYTEEEVTQAYQSMNSDPYWQERGGADIGNVASNIHKEIKKVKRQNTSLPSQKGETERPSFLVSEEKRQRNMERLRQRSLASGNE